MRSTIERRLSKSLPLYCLFAGTFLIGYILGVLQSSGWCIEGSNAVQQTQASVVQRPHSAFLVVVIFSAPFNYERRRAVRETWLQTKHKLSILHFFAVGSNSLDHQQVASLQSEGYKHRDMMILDSVSESYSKLSEKLREVFVWLDRNTDFEFLLKVDDDSFARLDALYLRLLKQSQTALYWGFFDGQARVKSKGKWLERSWFLCDRYLPYAKGGGYVISRDVVQTLAKVSDQLSLYKNEDVSLGTWLAPFEMKRVHDTAFDTEYVPRGCSNSYLVTHKQSTAMMYSKYVHLKATGNLCTSEYKTRNSYQYNWNVLPSQCCIRNDSRIP